MNIAKSDGNSTAILNGLQGKNELPKVSVIIPSFNSERFIRDTVDSVAVQDYKNYEILVVDDGSTDTTMDVVESLRKEIPEIVPLKNKRTKGVSGARNTGLDNASGKYIAFLDADDIWLPHHLSNAVSFLERYSDIDIVLYNFNVLNYENKKYLFNWFEEKSFYSSIETQKLEDGYLAVRGDIFNALINESAIIMFSVIRKSICEDFYFNEEVKRAADRDFYIRLYMEKGATFAFKDMVTAIYYRHNNNMSFHSISNSLISVNSHIQLFNGYKRYPLNAATRRELDNLISRRYLNKAYLHRKMREFRESFYSVMMSMRHDLSTRQLIAILKILAEAFLTKLSPGVDGEKQR